jgi:MoaA/NifB/PqqE/SkfB family radical SAM enzyme
MPDKRTLVVDVTYRCNGSCRYCRWAAGPIPDRIDPELEDLVLTPNWLGVLGTERVVLSGGEPVLSLLVGMVLEHYSRHVAERVVITNGILMDGSRREELLDAGATGFTFSIDSLDPAINGASRGLDLREHRLVLDNLADAAFARDGRAFELGINTVVTTANARSASIHELLRLAEDLDLDFVKFNPMFDDGHAGRTAPELRLSGACARELERIGNGLPGTGRTSTNPPGFWTDLAALVGGQHIPVRSCALVFGDNYKSPPGDGEM